MTQASKLAAAVRQTAGLFELPHRQVIEVRGSDRVRWLNGMLSNDIAALEVNAPNSGCYALLLTRQGRIVADLQVLAQPDVFWLDVESAAAEATISSLEKFIVADDVELVRRPTISRLGLEGPNARRILDSAAPRGFPDLAPNGCAEIELAGVSGLVAAFGWSGEVSFQFFFEAAGGAPEAFRSALSECGSGLGMLAGSLQALEILRVEAGVPRFGSELDEGVLPAEARLERAISTTKGCYTGQEVVERMRARGRVGHLLVGLRAAGAPPEPGMRLTAAAGGSASVGEVTSVCRSDLAGPIALGFVRVAHAEPGNRVYFGAASTEVVELPFVAPSSVS